MVMGDLKLILWKDVHDGRIMFHNAFSGVFYQMSLSEALGRVSGRWGFVLVQGTLIIRRRPTP